MNRGGCGPFVKLVVELSLLLTINLFIMNKKFSTLMAAALLAGSFSVVAQNAHGRRFAGRLILGSSAECS